MTKNIAFLLLFFFTIADVKSQELIFPSFVQPDRSNVTTIGFKGGIGAPSFLYTNPKLKKTPRDWFFRPLGGLFVDIPINEWLITPSVMYTGLGISTTYIYKNDYKVHYLVHSNYLDYRLSVSYRKRLTREFFVYAFLSPGLGVLLDGDLSLNQPGLDIPSVSIEMTDANMRETNIFVAGGIGAQYYINMPRFSLTMKLEIGYNQGVSNTFSQKEIDETAIPTNVFAYNTGKRFTRNIEMLFHIGLPLKFDKLKCFNFGSTKQNDIKRYYNTPSHSH